MKRKSIAKKLAVTGLAAAIALSMSVSAFAATINDEATTSQIFTTLDNAITKNVKYANGVTVPDNETFTFTFSQDTTTDGLVHTAASIPAVTITSNEITAVTTDSTKNSGNTTAFTSKGTIDLSALTTAGTYRYTVAESSKTVSENDYGWTSDSNTYTMTVVVQADGTKSYTIWNGTEKISSLNDFAFTNTYTKRGGSNTTNNDKDNDNNQDSLVIAKATSGTNIPNTDTTEYSFTINFTKSATASELPKSFTATKVDKDGNVATSATSIATKNGTFTLKSGEKLVFNDIPAGTYYTISEGTTNATESTAKLDIVANGNSENTITGTKGEGVSNTTAALIGEDVNSATITNTYSTITLTGITSQYGALIAIVLLAAAGMAALIIRRRRQNA